MCERVCVDLGMYVHERALCGRDVCARAWRRKSEFQRQDICAAAALLLVIQRVCKCRTLVHIPPSYTTFLCWYFLAGFVFSQPCMNPPPSYSRKSAVFASAFCELFLTDLFEAVLDF